MRKGIRLLVATLAVMVWGPGIALEGTSAGAAEGSRVSIVDADSDAMKWRFEPAEITVPVGSTVVWRNDGNQPHTVTADDGSFESPYLTGGQEWQWNFSSPGEFSYYCEPHPWMKAVVRVVAGSGSNPAPAPAPKPAPPAPAPAPPPAPAQPAPGNPAATPAPSQAASPAPKSPAPPAPTTQGGATGTPASTTTTTAAAAGEPAPNATPGTPAEAPADTSSGAPNGEEAAAVRPSGVGSGSEDYNEVAIALAVVATLACMALGTRMLLAKS